MIEVQISNKSINTEARFNPKDEGPFVIFIEGSLENLGCLHPMAVGKIILLNHKNVDKSIDEIKPQDKKN